MAEGSRKNEDSFHVHRALNHPLRRRIVEMLGKKGSVSFTEFKSDLKVRVGTLYYHFDMLTRVISQDEQKRYILTELGAKAYELMRAEEGRSQPSELKGVAPKLGIGGYIRNLLVPTRMFSYVYRRQKIGTIIAMITIVIGSLVSFQAKLEPVLFFFDPARPNQDFLIPLSLVTSWLGVFVIADVLAILLFKRKGDDQLLLIGSAISFAPLVLFPAVALLSALMGGSPSFVVHSVAGRALLVMLQSWSFVLLTQAVSVSKGLGMEKSIILALIVAYFNIMVLFVLGRVG